MTEMMEVERVEPGALVEVDEHEALMNFEASKSVPFITAAWASVGVAIMASSLGGVSSITRYLSEHLLVAVPFVLGVYVTSYLGGRWLMRKRVRENVFWSIGASFLVSEGVLLFGSLLGAIGGVIQELIAGKAYIDFGEFMVMPFFIAFFGAMFCLPLAIGLGAHVRLWTLWKTQRLRREEAAAIAQLPSRPVSSEA